MSNKSKRKRHGMSSLETGLTLIIYIMLIIFGTFETMWVLDDWYHLPDYWTDDSLALLSGVLFIGLALAVDHIASLLNVSGAGERAAKGIFLLLIAIAPLWSLGVCYLRYQTAAYYKNAQSGLCYAQGGHGKTYLYVKDSDWCQHFGFTIARPSHAEGEE